MTILDTDLADALREAGCTDRQIKRIVHLHDQGTPQEVVHELRCCRCEQLDHVHKEQKKIDIYDYLIVNLKEKKEKK